ncbi:T9SS type A sorting domain-containing protein [Algibacter sp. PT7-4]|uniref:T9SS type A sorting domain-containing protein n=1 Tax=Algibacter ulvanivorans TaxID=3400999 RepID=UPI003AAA677C
MTLKLPLKLILTALVFFIGLFLASAQVSLKKISLKEQIDSSSLVVEGEVVDSKSFWDVERKLIYTANTVKVYKAFKGHVAETIDVITLGGSVGLDAMIASNTLKLRKGDVGVFTLYDSKVVSGQKSKIKHKAYQAYSSLQGFYKYNVKHNVAFNPFNRKKGVQSSFYNEIMSYTNTNYTKVSDFDVYTEQQQLNKSSGLLALGITNFSPTTTTAGTGSVITINGTDFGAVKGKVGFANPDSGGMSGGNPDYVDALDSQVLTWSNTQITVEVPYLAGTGKIRITHDNNSTVESATSITITYAQQNVETDVGAGLQAFQTQHYGDNTDSPASGFEGGYTWEMQTDFHADTEHPGARAAFERAFESWRCETKVNWEISTNATTVDVIGLDEAPADGELEADGVNVIRFDNGAELPAGVLGRCTSWYSGRLCSGEVILWVSDIDIVFNDGTNWYFGTGGIVDGQFDFETVALHELGHGHQLGHVINTNNVMHYAVSDEEINTVLDANSIAGANDVHARSTTNQVCGMPVKPLMTNYDGDCNLNVKDVSFENGVVIFPNPAKQELFIKNSSYNPIDRVVVFDVSGRLIIDVDVSNTSGTKTINLNKASKGMYFVNIYSGKDTITKKLLVE